MEWSLRWKISRWTVEGGEWNQGQQLTPSRNTVRVQGFELMAVTRGYTLGTCSQL